MIQLISNKSCEDNGLSIVTRGKSKGGLYSHSTKKQNDGSVIMRRTNMKSGSAREIYMNQMQADVHIHQQVAKSLVEHPCPTLRPYTSMVGLAPQVKHLKERDILVRFAVPGMFEYPAPDVSLSLNGLETFDFYNVDKGGTVKPAILTIYPRGSGYFATLKSKTGYLGLPMTQWMSLVPLWEKTTKVTEIAVIIDSEGLPYNRHCTQDSNRSVITPLGITTGFYNGNAESYDSHSERQFLLSLSAFESALEPVAHSEGHFGFAYCPQLFQFITVDPRQSLLMEILGFDSSNDSWLLGFSDERKPLFTVPYNYSDFYSKGYQLAVVTTVTNGVVGELISYQFHSSCTEDYDSTTAQL